MDISKLCMMKLHNETIHNNLEPKQYNVLYLDNASQAYSIQHDDIYA